MLKLTPNEWEPALVKMVYSQPSSSESLAVNVLFLMDTMEQHVKMTSCHFHMCFDPVLVVAPVLSQE